MQPNKLSEVAASFKTTWLIIFYVLHEGTAKSQFNLIMSTQLSDILQLSIAERIQLAEDIWDSVAASPESVLVTDEQRQELDRRLQAYAQNPGEGVSWEELKDKVRKPA